MPNISRERRSRWIERTLAELPFLTARQRRFLSVPLAERGWHLLIERTATTSDRAAVFAIGRTGVYALVFTDTVPDRSQVLRIRKRSEEMLTGLLFGHEQFVPHMFEVALLMSAAAATGVQDGYLTCDESTMYDRLITGERKLSARRARDIAASIAERSAGYEWLSADEAPQAESVTSEGLFGTSDLTGQARGNALTRPFQEWMTFLDPEQLALVHANFNGPARFSGPAGTGKSVVALHRMARFAKHNPGRLLFTSFVRTLPTYHRSGFVHLAPHAVDRVKFVGLHSWAMGLLTRREVEYHLDEGAQEDSFARTWQRARDVLGRVEGTDYQYWKDEIDRVIKGRGLETLAQYQGIRRTGRDGIQLHGRRREYVWKHWYLPYQDRLRDKGADDFNDIIRKAVDELRDRPLDDTEDYAMVVVDEVQDCTLMELRLVHEIAGGGPGAQLLLVGDGQQQVYAGGWRLSDAGIPLPGGRGRVLRTNYRNRDAVLRYTKRIEAGNTVDDLDGGPGFVLRDSDAVLTGGSAIEKRLRRKDIDAELVRAITESPLPQSDIAVIVNTRKEAAHYQQVLERAGLPTLSLERYDGARADVIKVGTVHRAKGMDFAAVFHITEQPPAPIATLTGGARDRAELLARQTLVASSRPRDFLWIAYLID
ncbi:UvrD-helicase domain-containing protein [Nocardia sp. NPDC050710]|uniref:UvrD-helicase domain-containing protein n=1 Tax=Nocardia sp. NPDC050710 TaxID=3157220 RepID=UPI0033FA039B